jgi:16S rRNA pseudouridine516 synthase
MSVRLDKLLSNMGYGTRREVQSLAVSGRVRLGADPLLDATARVTADDELAARLTIDDAALDPLPGMALMLHKPRGVTCSHKDPGPLVFELLPQRWRARDPALSTVGRLDKDTSGLLLLTDDGGLLHRIISPKAKLEKSYVATLARPLRGDEAAFFASGSVMLDGETTPLLPARLEPLSATSARLSIMEGRYHQVRRMFAAAGNHVEALHRDRIGRLSLPDDLAPGAFRLMTREAISELFGG